MDLRAPSQLNSPLLTFLNLAVTPALGPDITDPLLELLESKELYPLDGPRLPTVGQIPIKPVRECSVLDFSPEEVARQISLEDRACLIQVRAQCLYSVICL